MFFLYSKSTKYAILALSYIARGPADRYIKIREIAASCHIPIQYLAKLVEGLRRGGLVESLRGPTGGLRLQKDPASITVKNILKSINELTAMERTCLLGKGVCDDDHECALHEKWYSIRADIYKNIETKSLKEISGIINRSIE